MKKVYLFLCVIFCITLTSCGNNEVVNNSSNNNVDDSIKLDTDSCYDECERFWWGDENVEMCKKNCDASNDEDSVWNKESDDYNNEEQSNSWSDYMPSELPEFTYWDAWESVEWMWSWIVDFQNVWEDALENYKSELEANGWTASIMSITNTLNWKLEGQYTIQVMYDPDYQTAQIMVNKVN